MILRTIWAVLLLLKAKYIFAQSTSILEVDTHRIIAKTKQNATEHHNYNATILPLLPSDFKLIQNIIETIEDVTCRKQCAIIWTELGNLSTWAAKFYDSSGRFPDGIFSGSLYQLGNFDECMEIGIDGETPEDIRGKYCLGEINIKIPESYLKRSGSIWESLIQSKGRYNEVIDKVYWGICVPAACKPEDIENGIQKFLSIDFSGSQLKLTPRISGKSCYKIENASINTLTIVYTCLILSVVLIILASTALHAGCIKTKNDISNCKIFEIVIAFSLISNVKKLLCSRPENDMHLDCISGIKFICMTIIIAAHSLMFVASGPIVNKRFWDEAVTKVENSIFLNNPLLVDTFLFLSGLLLCRILLAELDKKKSVNFLLLYVARYIRLTPAYFAIVGLYCTWLTGLDSGPLWFKMEVEKGRCLSSWWTNLLYINNYVNTDQLCMFQSWYLSVDTQLFILAPLIIYPLWRWPRIGLYFLIGATTVSMMIPFVLTLLNDLDPTLLIYIPDIKDITNTKYFNTTYIKTHMRAEAYCFGLVYGYIVYRVQTEEKQLSKKTVRLGWLIGIFSLIVSMSSIVIFYGPRKYFTAIEAAMYSIIHRALWCFGIGWIIIACVTDNSGPVRNFLKWQLFVPLGRLTYSAYLVNGLVVLHSLSTTRSPQNLSNFSLLCVGLSHFMLTFGGATLLSLTFESPILGLKRIFVRDEKESSKNSEREADTSAS